MDRITKSLLTDFVEVQTLAELPESDAFERFANYCVIAREFTETFNVEDFSVGAGNDAGIDGVVVSVNGTLVAAPEEIEDLLETNGHIDASFIFVQAKTSSNFSGADIGTFLFGVADFFADEHKLAHNEKLAEARALQEKVFELSARFRENPTCRLYYVTTGKWMSDALLRSRIDGGVRDLEDVGIFSAVEFVPVDAATLHIMYRNTKNRVSCEFTFANKVALPEIGGVTEAYLGYLPAREYLKLITDELGRIRKSLFYDNVRDFQDYNVVNQQIRKTLEDPESRDRFPVLNNGVTIVAKSLRTTGNKCLVEDYQIVNGCQTSHVVFDQAAILDESTFVPVKLVATGDDAVTGSITRATNTQTEVRSEELHALSELPKKLELFFEAFDGKKKLYYERRTRQYASRSDIEKVRIVSLPNLVRAFTAMFLDEPHRVGRAYRKLLEDVGTKIFSAEHQLDPYYVSAFALYRLEYLFRAGHVDVKHKPARYQILFGVRRLASDENMPGLGSNAMKRYCDGVSAQLWDDEQCVQLFSKAADEVAACAIAVQEASPGTRATDLYRVGIFTQTLAKNLAAL